MCLLLRVLPCVSAWNMAWKPTLAWRLITLVAPCTACCAVYPVQDCCRLYSNAPASFASFPQHFPSAALLRSCSACSNVAALTLGRGLTGTAPQASAHRINCIQPCQLISRLPWSLLATSINAEWLTHVLSSVFYSGASKERFVATGHSGA